MPEAGGTSFAALTNEELIELLRDSVGSAENGHGSAQLQEEIVRRNVGLVKSIAVKFLGSGEPLDDLIQAGYIGLLNAAANFDLARNTRFSTYASYLIQGEIRHFIRDKHSTIRIPQGATGGTSAWVMYPDVPISATTASVNCGAWS